MIGATTQVQTNHRKVTKAVKTAAFKNLGHAAARIAKDAKESVVRAEGPSEPGTPPHTHRGKFLSRAIRFDNDREAKDAVIGPRESIVGTAGSAHEHGGEYKGATFPERKFMFPAMERNLDRFAGDWAGSVGE